MTAVNYSIRIDKKLRDEAFEVLDCYGLTPSLAFRLFLKQVAGTGTVPLSFDYAQSSLAYERNPTTMQAISDAREGKVTRYDNSEALLNELSQGEDGLAE